MVDIAHNHNGPVETTRQPVDTMPRPAVKDTDVPSASAAPQVPANRPPAPEQPPISTAARDGRPAPGVHYLLAAIRLALGWLFLWAFLDKAFGLGHDTTSAKAWIHGGSPTKGFLGSATKGPFTGFYHSLAGTTFADVFFMIALAAIGRRTPRGSRGSGTEASTSTRASPWAARTASASNAASPGLSTPLPAARETGMRDWTGNGASRRLVI